MEHDAPTKASSAKMEGQQEKKAEEEAMSLEEMTKYRAAAQQNSIDAIRAAEERYAEAKDAAAAALKNTKEAVAHGVGAAATYAVVKGAEAKDAAAHGARVVAGYTAEKGAVAKDAVVEKGQQDYQAAKDRAVSAGRAAADYTQQAAGRAKGATVCTGKSSAEHAKDQAEKAKEVTVTGKSAAEHAKEMTDKARQVTVSTGESTVEYVREKAVEAKDATARAAHKAAEYTSQKAAEAKASAGAAVWAVAQKAEAAKVAARSAAQKGPEYTTCEVGETTEETTSGKQREVNFEEDEAGEVVEAGDGASRRAERDKTEESPQEREMEIHGAEDDTSKTAEQRGVSVGGDEQPASVLEAEHGDSGERYYGAEAARQQGEPRIYLRREAEKGTSTSGVGGLFEAMGEAVMGIAQTAKELLMGSERGK